MVQLVCPCLNIRIHSKGTSVQLRDSCDLKLSDRVLADDFFSSQVYDVLLDLGGVTKAQKSLCTSRCIDNWVITSCIGCELEIYAKHLDDEDRVLVSCSIEDPSRITTLMESENYSSLFKLLLPEINDNFAQNNLGLELCSNEDSFERALKQMQQQVSSFLKDEQKAMEERIRVFTEQQQSRYSTLQQKVKKHKQAMLFLMLKCRDVKKSLPPEQLCDSLSPPCPLDMSQHLSDDSSSSSDSAHIGDKSSDFLIKNIEQKTTHSRRPFRRLHSVNNPPQKPKVARPLKHNTIDVGDVFDMEGFETGDMDAPFYNSDDDTDGSSTEDHAHSKRANKTSKHCASSVPISVPAWSSYSRFSIHDDEEYQAVPHADAEQLAASFRALAEGSSVNDGTEIFGALPRRRLNTGELIYSRPI